MSKTPPDIFDVFCDISITSSVSGPTLTGAIPGGGVDARHLGVVAPRRHQIFDALDLGEAGGDGVLGAVLVVGEHGERDFGAHRLESATYQVPLGRAAARLARAEHESANCQYGEDHAARVHLVQ